MSVESDILKLYKSTGTYIRASEAVKQYYRFKDPLIRKALILRTLMSERAAKDLTATMTDLQAKYKITDKDIQAKTEEIKKGETTTERGGDDW